jgi:hypothetical protein
MDFKVDYRFLIVNFKDCNGFSNKMGHPRCVGDCVIDVTVYLVRNFYLAVF